MQKFKVKSKVETLKEDENGMLLKVTTEVILGGLVVNKNANNMYVAKLVDGMTNLTDTNKDDLLIDPVAKMGINSIPTKVWYDSENESKE